MPLLHSTSRRQLAAELRKEPFQFLLLYPLRYCFSCQIAHRSRLNTNQPWPTQKGAFISALLQSQDGFGFSRCAPPPPLPAPPATPSKYYAKVVIKGKPHFAPFLHSLRRRYSRRGGFYVLCRDATGEVRPHNTAARCRGRILFCKIRVRPRAYWSYPLW